MALQGKQLIAGVFEAKGTETYQAVDASTNTPFGVHFVEGTVAEVAAAAKAAADSFDALRTATVEARGQLLDHIADEIMALGDDLLEMAHQETGLPMGRCTGERGRAVNQIRLFANVIREGSWVNARIDTANPDRTPAPKPDVRSMLVGIGPVAVFGASNFPLAIGVAGTDTVTALGAGCPVVVKAHPAHPGTSELLAMAITKAVKAAGFPAGIFSMVHGRGHEVGLAMARDPHIKAVAFTGGLRGGRALFDAAAARPEPIPVYAEMGSTNPVFLLPGALKARSADIAKGYLQSVNLGVGQFCTNPGILLGLKGEGMSSFQQASGELATAVTPATMLHAGISKAFADGVDKIGQTPGVSVLGQSADAPAVATQAGCAIFATDIDTLKQTPYLMEEVFGPTSIVVACNSVEEMEEMAEGLEGHLSATVHGTPEDLAAHKNLIQILEKKVGRIIINGYPTGIEVCAAMHHGGPYPASTDSHYTSIGTGSLLRFGRPVCYQGFPNDLLPPQLRNANEKGIWRMVNNEMTRENVG
ncbi:MAG: aldehyde dehydrogenase (NADP(+)) [Bacteroidota bacterium]